MGYKVEERIGASVLEVIHPDDLQYLADKVIILFTDTRAPVVQFVIWKDLQYVVKEPLL